jgi:hypothetical protein
VYLSSINGLVPEKMVQCISEFVECCYIARHNAITSSDLEAFEQHLTRFQDLRNIFIETGVCTSISLPRQHSLCHYVRKIELFGSPNGVCSSITESMHITAVKEPWRRSSRSNPLLQMIKTISRQDKLAALRRVFENRGMLEGMTSHYISEVMAGNPPTIHPYGQNHNESVGDDDGGDDDDGGPLSDPITLAQVTLAVVPGKPIMRAMHFLLYSMISQSNAIRGP